MAHPFKHAHLVWIQMTTSVFVFFQYIFPIYQHWNIGLKNSGSLGPVTNMYYDGSQDFELEEDKLYVDFIIFTLLELHICIIMIMTC